MFPLLSISPLSFSNMSIQRFVSVRNALLLIFWLLSVNYWRSADRLTPVNSLLTPFWHILCRGKVWRENQARTTSWIFSMKHVQFKFTLNISENKLSPSILTVHRQIPNNTQTATIMTVPIRTSFGGISPMMWRIFSLLNSILSFPSIVFIDYVCRYILWIKPVGE